MMETKQLVDSILEAVREDVTHFIEIEGQIDSSVEYEERILEIARHFCRNLIVQSKGKMPKSRNSKKKF